MSTAVYHEFKFLIMMTRPQNIERQRTMFCGLVIIKNLNSVNSRRPCPPFEFQPGLFKFLAATLVIPKVFLELLYYNKTTVNHLFKAWEQMSCACRPLIQRHATMYIVIPFLDPIIHMYVC